MGAEETTSHIENQQKLALRIDQPKQLFKPKFILECELCNAKFRNLTQFFDHYVCKHKGNFTVTKRQRYLKAIRKTTTLFDFFSSESKIEFFKGGLFQYKIPKIPILFTVVNAGYIEKRISECKTKGVVFGHRDYTEFGNFGCDHKEFTLIKCLNRACPKCESSRIIRLFNKYYPYIKKWNRVTLVTFTFKHHIKLDPEFKRKCEYQMKLFLKELKRYLLKINKNYYTDFVFTKEWINKIGKRQNILNKTIESYRTYPIKFVKALEIKKSKTDNSHFWHFHCLMDIPYLDNLPRCKCGNEYIVSDNHCIDQNCKLNKLLRIGILGKLWFKATKSSYNVDIKYVGSMSKEVENRLNNSNHWNFIKKNYGNSPTTRATYYIIKYIAKMNWLDSQEYSEFAYSRHFISKGSIQISKNKIVITTVRIQGKSEPKKCPKCNQILEFLSLKLSIEGIP